MPKPRLYICTKADDPNCPLPKDCPHVRPHMFNYDPYDPCYRKLGECCDKEGQVWARVRCKRVKESGDAG
jgi:hypothetical protein